MAAWKPGGKKHFSPSGSRAAIFCHARQTKCITHDGLSERGTTRSLVLHTHSLCKWKLRWWKSKSAYTLFCFILNVVSPAQAEYSYFSADFRLITFLYYSLIIAYDISVLEFIGVSIISVWYLDLYCVTLCMCSIAFRCSQWGLNVMSNVDTRYSMMVTKVPDFVSTQV